MTHEMYELSCIAPNGVGYGEGAISACGRASHPNYPVTQEDVRAATQVLIERHDDIIIPIEADDDGCGDGRPTERIVEGVGTPRVRAKIFGGGVLVATSMWRAIRGAPNEDETFLSDSAYIARRLTSHAIHYGAHTDTHAHGNTCGCGAIDKFRRTVQASGTFQEQIRETARLWADTTEVMEQVFETRAHVAASTSYVGDAIGSDMMALMLREGAIVKELRGDHLETIVIFNNEPGTTVDQQRIADILSQAGLPAGMQAFVVDTWRGEMYAQAVADIAATRGFDHNQAARVAQADFYINQLSVAATLTAGDLPVLVNTQR